MTKIEYVTSNDKAFWYNLDKHLPEQEFENKVQRKQGYVLFADNKPVGLLRYNLFWDNTPFCTMLFVDWQEQHKGYGKKAVKLALDFIQTFPCGKAEYCWLSYEPENTVAKELYASFGFKETGDMDGEEIIAVLKL